MKLSHESFRSLLVASAGLVISQVIGACSGDEPPQTSSATHFLEDCAASCSAGLTCLCGVCTRPCQAPADCSAITENATCVPKSDAHPSCGGSAPARLCDVACKATADCDATPGAPLCVSGFCRSTASAAAGPDGSKPDNVGGRDGGPGRSNDSGTGAANGVDAGGPDAPGSGGAGGRSGDAGASGGGATSTPDGSATSTPDGGASEGGGTTPSDCSARILYDPKNCGRCNHDCLGGSCVSGVCAPVILALGQDSPFAIAVDATEVYWMAGGGLKKVPKTGGATLATITALVSGTIQSTALALSDTDVFFLFGEPESLSSVPKTGGAVSPISQPSSGIGVAVDATNVYFMTGKTLTQQPLGGGAGIPIATLAQSPPYTPRLAVDATSVYWYDPVAKAIQRTPIGGGAAVSLGSTAVAPLSIAVYGGVVYWTDGAQFGSVVGAATDGSGTRTVADSQNAPTAVAADASGVYWTNGGTSGTVLTRSLGGGQITVLTSGQGIPIALATDASAVYFSDNGSGMIMKVAKP